jgi:hypothetical protein
MMEDPHDRAFEPFGGTGRPARWTDTRGFLWVGRSGYEYTAEVSTTRDTETLTRLVLDFYLSRRATLIESSPLRITLRRGRKLARWYGFFETQHPQTIEIRLRSAKSMTTASIRYHALFFGFLIGPNSLVREVGALRRALATDPSGCTSERG